MLRILHSLIKISLGPSTVAHVHNPSYSKDGDLEDHSSRPAQAKVIEVPSQSVSCAWWGIPVIPATWQV
jgi:hypothetical protein